MPVWHAAEGQGRVGRLHRLSGASSSKGTPFLTDRSDESWLEMQPPDDSLDWLACLQRLSKHKGTACLDSFAHLPVDIINATREPIR